MHARIAPGVAELVGRHGDGRESSRGLRLVEAEAFRELGGDQVPERPVVDQQEELDVRSRGGRIRVRLTDADVMRRLVRFEPD